MTQREFYEFATNVFATVDVEGKEDAMEYIIKATAALDAKNAKAKERAAEKRAASDAMRAAIANVLGEEPMTIPEIMAAIETEYPDVTPAKIVSRMKGLVDNETAVKTVVKAEGRKLTAYTKA
jgi:hypothetical protein